MKRESTIIFWKKIRMDLSISGMHSIVFSNMISVRVQKMCIMLPIYDVFYTFRGIHCSGKIFQLSAANCIEISSIDLRVTSYWMIVIRFAIDNRIDAVWLLLVSSQSSKNAFLNSFRLCRYILSLNIPLEIHSFLLQSNYLPTGLC